MRGWRGKCTVAPAVRQRGTPLLGQEHVRSHSLFPYFHVLCPDVLQPAVDLDPEVALERLWAERLGIAVPHSVPDTCGQTVEKVGRVGADPGDALRRGWWVGYRVGQAKRCGGGTAEYSGRRLRPQRAQTNGGAPKERPPCRPGRGRACRTGATKALRCVTFEVPFRKRPIRARECEEAPGAPRYAPTARQCMDRIVSLRIVECTP